MTIELDHIIVPSKDAPAAAKQLGELLGVAWSATGAGPFSPVYVNAGLTLDIQTTDEAFPIHHVCFRVDDATFDAVLARIKAAGLAYRSGPHGPMDMRVGEIMGGRNVYWTAPDGHYWELLTVSYARQPGKGNGTA